MASDPLQSDLSPRAHHLLKTLVEQYIRDGNPVGSRTLSRDSGLEVSAATVRNVMADLEEMGLIAAPHTSAGRVPTVQGYRLFVDTMLTMKPPGADAVARARAALDQGSRGPRCESRHLPDSVISVAAQQPAARHPHCGVPEG